MSDVDDSRFQKPEVYAEGTWLHGAIVTAVLYGIVVVLYALCAQSLWGRIRSGDGVAKKHWFFLVYVNFIFAISTLYIASNSQMIQLGFINHRDYSGGPNAYELDTASAPLNVAFVLSNWCADVLMIWRCAVVYKDCKYHLVVTWFGWFLFLASVATGSLWVIVVSRPEQSTTDWMSFTYLFPYLLVGLVTNIFISLLTVVRLLYHRARVSKVLGPAYGTLYTSFAGIIVESAAVYSTCSLLCLVPYVLGSPLANAFMQILGEAQVIAPLLIILRVSKGEAWTKSGANHFPSSGSRTGRQLSYKPTQISSRSTKLDVQVALECIQHSDHDNSIRFVERDDKNFAV